LADRVIVQMAATAAQSDDIYQRSSLIRAVVIPVHQSCWAAAPTDRWLAAFLWVERVSRKIAVE